MRRIDLAQCTWTLNGWAENEWRMQKSAELNENLRPEVGPVPGIVPGSVQQALLKAKLIPDWTVGLNSRLCEWVENRHWDYTTWLEPDLLEGKKGVRLVCQGLDYHGAILIDGKEVNTFAGTLTPHVFDLTAHLAPGQRHALSIIFFNAPEEQGQIGFTSRSHFFKPRFAYKWDWSPRLVPVGVWDKIWLEVGDAPRLNNVRPRTELKGDLATGLCSVDCKIWTAKAGKATLTAFIRKAGQVIAQAKKSVSLKKGDQTQFIKFDPMQIEAWQPNGCGDPALYDLEVELLNVAGEPEDQWSGLIGFKKVRWLPCAGAAKDALPWICEVNGNKLFLQGANWVPIRPNYHDLTRADYAKRIKEYRKLGFNILRVWGGGILEKQDFYELCDEHGLLVWQEFPLSSSGIENSPPRDPEAIAQLVKIAESYIERRGGHVCKLLWCGGNELQTDGPGDQAKEAAPQTEAHPCLKALGDVVRRMDPGVRFLPTSAYGPVFYAQPENFGKGIHHNVHGPWKLWGTLEEWEEYWTNEDALLRAETGAPSASPLDILEKFKGDCDPWPPSIDNPYWRHRGAWWVEWDRFQAELPNGGGMEALRKYVELSQALQTRALVHATRSRKKKFPATAGIIFWMGHDTFPCTANTAIIDYFGRPKPAAKALAKIFKTKPEDL